jgi:hypothetical protein
MPSACNSETCSERPSRSTDQAITCRSGAARLELELARASVFQKFSKRSGLVPRCIVVAGVQIGRPQHRRRA